MDLELVLSLGGVVVFWIVMFGLAIWMARRALRGVGEPVAEEGEAHTVADANGSLQGNGSTMTPSMQESGKSTRGAGDH